MLNSKYLFLYALTLVCCVIEGMLSLSDRGITTPENLRSIAYFSGAFWPGLLENWKPNYAAQPYVMFISHSFLHTGLMHLAVNMIALWMLGRIVAQRVGQGGLVFLYIVSTLGGGLGFSLLADNVQPMVGASGALFGLLGAVLTWNFEDSREDREALRDFAKDVTFLLLLNLIYWWAMDGHLAWEAHVGGLLAGCAGAILLRRITPDRGASS